MKDTARAMITVLEAPRELVNGQVFNVGSEDQNVQIMPLARMVAEAIDVPFEYEWYGSPDHRSYRVSFRKIDQVLAFKTQYGPSDGAREIYGALQEGLVDPDDPRTITVQWYRQLIDMHQFLKQVEIQGVLL